MSAAPTPLPRPGASPTPAPPAESALRERLWTRLTVLVVWGVLAVVVGNDLVRFWRVGDPPLPDASDFFPFGDVGALIIGVLGVLGVGAAFALQRAARLHVALFIGLALLLGGVAVAAALPLPEVVLPDYQPFVAWRSLALMVGLVGVAAAAAQWSGRYLRDQLFAVTVGVTWLGFAMTALKWLRQDPVTLTATDIETPSIFPVVGLVWNPNILAMVMVFTLVVQFSWLQDRRDVASASAGEPRPGWRLWLIGPVASWVLLVASLSRAGIVVGAVVTVVMLWPRRREQSSRASGWRPAAVMGRGGWWLFAALGVGVVAVALAPPLIAAAGGPDINARSLIWQRAWDAIVARPLLGWGADSGGHQHAHNQFLESWQSGGAVALVGLAVVVGVAVVAAVRYVALDARLALGLVIAASLEAGVEVLTPWRKFPSLPLALLILILGLVASISLGRDRADVAPKRSHSLPPAG